MSLRFSMPVHMLQRHIFPASKTIEPTDTTNTTKAIQIIEIAEATETAETI